LDTLSADKLAGWIEQQAAIQPLVEGEQRQICCELELVCHWLPAQPICRLGFDVTLGRAAGRDVALQVAIQNLDEPAAAALRLRLDQPLRLDPVHIAKPWGQEIWYTGVEQRGVCGFVAEGGEALPLPWLLETLSPWLSGGRRELVLLKILDPLAAQVWGDLYFELHQEKREVYVVSHVDSEAWPDGVGAIRFGFDPQRVAEFADDGQFRAAFRASVAAYEAIRREIDSALDVERGRQGIALDAPVPPEQLQAWQQQLPSGLLQRERQLRQDMEAFTHLKPLRVGDVVKVPCHTPHALQHGVRTVEFQTPVYERKILSFAQKVLTQDHWDTEEAVALMALEPEPEQPFTLCFKGDGVVAEKIVDFADFEVQRWRLAPTRSHQLAVAGRYAVVMAVAGEVEIAGCRLAPGQACLVPGQMDCTSAHQYGADETTLLVAYPV
jgi:hypothetical protein